MKQVHLHIGPHKTGSTALQAYFKSHADLIMDQSGWRYVDDAIVADTALAMNEENLPSLAVHLTSIGSDKILIINEDFCGDFPIRNGVRTLYPSLRSNLQMIKDTFDDYDLSISFCHRQMATWLQSVYHQNLKFRAGLKSFDHFEGLLDFPLDWIGLLTDLKSAMSTQCTVIDYDAAGSDLHMAMLDTLGADIKNLPAFDPANVSPKAPVIKLLELINQSSCSRPQNRAAKTAILGSNEAKVARARLDSVLSIEKGSYSDWPLAVPDAKVFPALSDRIAWDMRADTQPDLMPEVNVDLHADRTQFLPKIEAAPDVSRAQMVDQETLLRFELQGQSILQLYHGLTISYLRRNTDHTQKARILFHRLWNEEHALLLGTLKTRWLISAFQTFADHGLSAEQRQIGAAAYYYANMIKVQEAERSFDGLQPDTIYKQTTPNMRQGFRGLDRFKLGNSDILPNMNAHLLGLTAQDEIVGRIVVEFMRRTQAAHTVFSRMDENRVVHEIENPNFQNAWSFGVEPKPQRADARMRLLNHLPKNSIGAEIGVWHGQFSQHILDVVQPRELHLIDPWSYQPDYDNTSFGAAENAQKMNQKFQAVTDKFGQMPQVTIHRAYSQDALASFPDGYFDWVYIDGNHNYEVVAADILLAADKVKPNGIICGDDLFWERDGRMHVRDAVHGFQRANSDWVSFSRFGAQYVLQLSRG